MLTKSLVAAATALAASTALSLPADAAPNNQVRGTVIFWLLDRNNDGQIDRSEVEALRTVVFDAVDTDSDGKVTREEFMAVIGDRGGPREMRGDRRDGPHRGQWEQRGDRRDGPRGPGYAEEGRGPGPHHGEFEGRGPHGGPGKGDFAEGPRPGPRHGEFEGRGPRLGPGNGDFAEGPGERMMDRLGIDDEDSLTKADFVGATPKLFERADADNNGSVSQSEFEQAPGNVGRLMLLE